MLERRRFMGAALGVLCAGALGLGCDDGKGGAGSAPKGSGAAAAAAAPAEWRVGAYLSLSGAETEFGQQTREGIELAVDEQNKAGGVKGKPVKVLFEDDKSNPQEATNKVLQLIDRDKVVAILGEVASSRSRAGGIVANKKGVPMITPSSTNPDVTKVGSFVFRVCFTDDVQGRMGADFIVNTLKKKKIALFYASDDLYSSGLAAEFKAEAKKLGAELVVDKSFLKTETNFTTYIKELKSSGAEIAYAPIYYTAMVPIARQARAEGIKGDFFVGGDGWDADSLLADAGEEMEGAYFTNHYAPDVPWPNAQKFIGKYKQRFGHAPTGMAATGYDAAGVLIDALGRAKSAEPAAIRDAIAETKGFQGATGTISIDAARNADKPIVVVQIKSKKFTYHSTVGGAAQPAAAPVAPGAGSAAASAAPAAGSTAPAASAAPAAK
jgi:branched-chain amino acid transport system substrate-binding protein